MSIGTERSLNPSQHYNMRNYQLKTIIIACFLVIAFAFATEKKYVLTEGQAAMLFDALQTAKKAIPASEGISAKEGSQALYSIDSIQRVLVKQAKDTTKNR